MWMNAEDLPESVWHQLPGGPDIDSGAPMPGERWQYMGSREEPGGGSFALLHTFRHRAHPWYRDFGARGAVEATYAKVRDSEAGPELMEIRVGGHELILRGLLLDREEPMTTGERFDDGRTVTDGWDRGQEPPEAWSLGGQEGPRWSL